jgi:hypothetical protein
MADNGFYYGKAVEDNQGVKHLIEGIMRPVYGILYDQPDFFMSPPVIIDEVNQVILGVWPEWDTPVNRLEFSVFGEMDCALRSGLIVPAERTAYSIHDGKQMIPFTLSEDQGLLKKHKLDGLLPGHAIYFFLEGKQEPK